MLVSGATAGDISVVELLKERNGESEEI